MRIFLVRLAVIFSHLMLLRPCGEVLAMYADVTIDLAAIVKATEGDEEMAAWCGKLYPELLDYLFFLDFPL